MMFSYYPLTLQLGMMMYTNPLFFVEEVTVHDSIRHLFPRCKRYLTTFNIFPSISPSTNEHELNTQRISTRLFLVIFITSLVVLLFYTTLIRIPKTITVETPSFAEYSHLNSIYSQTLTCPCSKISINYRKFIRVEYTLHQVCSSFFVSHTWFEYLTIVKEMHLYHADVRATSGFAFQALKAFCELINITILNSLTEFYSNQHVSAFTIPQQLLNSQTESLTDKFRSSVTNTFSLSLVMIRDTTQANALYSAHETNYYMHRAGVNRLVIRKTIYDNCVCSSSSTCIRPFAFYNYPNLTPLFDVPDFYIGCYIIEALLQSTLKCFYNQSCIDKLDSYISPSASMTIIALDASLPTQYSVDSTIQELVNNLMIEEWNVSTMYETYYNECQPTHCTYTLESRNNIVYIVTALFGIAGGLITSLRLIVPRLVKLARKKREQQRQTTGKIKSKTGKWTALKLVVEREIDYTTLYDYRQHSETI